MKLTKEEIKNLAENHKLFRRLALLWAMSLVTAISLIVFIWTPDIPHGTSSAYNASLIILTAVIALYQFLRKKDDEIVRKHLLAEKMIDNGLYPPDELIHGGRNKYFFRNAIDKYSGYRGRHTNNSSMYGQTNYNQGTEHNMHGEQDNVEQPENPRPNRNEDGYY